jgi:glycosyltransferase involved in cell wall biosynthesis
MVENKQWAPNSNAYKILFYFEKLQTKMAYVVIGTTKGMLDYAKKKYNTEIKNFFVKPACVNLDQFSYDKERNQKLVYDLGLEDKIVMLYAGKFGGIYFDKEVFEFIKEAGAFFGKNNFKALILSNINKDDLDLFCKETGLDNELIVHRFVSHSKIQNYMNLADFAISPIKPIPTKRYCTPIKNGEYWAMGLPVVIPKNISDDSQIISKYEIGYVLDDMNTAEYQKALKCIDKLLHLEDMRSKIRSVAVKYRDFNVADEIYRKIYE